MSNLPKKETTIKAKDLIKPSQQVLTIVDFTMESPFIKLECPNCHDSQDRIGARFCSNCGTPLAWENILIRQPRSELQQGNPNEAPNVEAKVPEENAGKA